MKEYSFSQSSKANHHSRHLRTNRFLYVPLRFGHICLSLLVYLCDFFGVNGYKLCHNKFIFDL